MQVTLSGADATSGVAATYYAVDGGSMQSYTAPFTVSGDRWHNVTYYSVDAAGNAESVQAVGFGEAVAPPVATLRGGGDAGEQQLVHEQRAGDVERDGGHGDRGDLLRGGRRGDVRPMAGRSA